MNQVCIHDESKGRLNSGGACYRSVQRSLARREEHRLVVLSENRVLRTFGPKMERAVRGWRRLHNEELRNFYASPNGIRY